MTDGVVVAGIAAFGAVVVALIQRVHAKVAEIEVKVDGRLTELLELTRVSSKAEGVVEGKESNDLRN